MPSLAISKAHRHWALRLFLVVGGVWFFRVGLMFWLLLNKGPVGFDPDAFRGPFLSFLSFVQYLLPLAVLEIYLCTRERGGTLGRLAMSAGLFVLTIARGTGIFAATVGMCLPPIKAASDNRKSIAATLSATIATFSVDHAARQYHDLKTAEPATYNFDEDELDTLGLELTRARKFEDAIRILQLNAEAYPQSGNVYDSLGKAYMDAGNKPQAIANYQRSLQLDPKNRNAVQMLQNLNEP
jgi:tetratricopeptide (TPR) repeat protein